jgi:hypothetical protein
MDSRTLKAAVAVLFENTLSVVFADISRVLKRSLINVYVRTLSFILFVCLLLAMS